MSGVEVALAIGAVLGLGAVSLVLGRRVRRAEHRITRLEADLRSLAAGLDGIGSEARAAALAARRATAAAGIDDPPRVALEPVTGRLVKAVAFSAGARRALAALAVARGPRRAGAR